ncbi:hypothetical protein ASF27_04200 [Methylobacterium sp. Leaf102]|nr:hypothetical protein ASF27_04200 [Methylobacterium sp. Leaf102]KQP32085.1 hypothetical protein ASF25_03990 [Methylobacterium sp. Leaf100]
MMVVMVAPVAPAVATVVIPAAMVTTPAAVMAAMMMPAIVAPVTITVMVVDGHELGLRSDIGERQRLGTADAEADREGEAGGEAAASDEQRVGAKSHDGLPVSGGRRHLDPVRRT